MSWARIYECKSGICTRFKDAAQHSAWLEHTSKESPKDFQGTQYFQFTGSFEFLDPFRLWILDLHSNPFDTPLVSTFESDV